MNTHRSLPYGFLLTLVVLLRTLVCCQETNADDEGAVQPTDLRLSADNVLQVTATISPIDFTRYGFHERWDELANFRASVPRKKWPAKAFKVFFPVKPVAVGDTWEIKEDVIRLIRQLHANATLKMHIAPGDEAGRWAMLRATNDRFAEIAFRVHADIPLKKGFLTFSQFTGRLVVDQVDHKIVFFRMYVPAGTINFDANWKPSPESRGYITDAGRCRHVELYSGNHVAVDAISWSDSIPIAKSELALARKFYPAWKINWEQIETALDRARRLNKPIHMVSADGPLKDEAC